MSTAATFAITPGDRYASSLKSLGEFSLQLSERFSRFLRELPEGYEDVGGPEGLQAGARANLTLRQHPSV